MKKMFRKTFIVALVFVLSVSSVFAYSKLDKIKQREQEQKRKVKEIIARKKEQKELRNEIDREYKQISKSIDANNAALKVIMNSIGRLENEIGALGLEIDELEVKIEEKNIEIDKVKEELSSIRNEKEKLKELGALRIKSIYENGEVSVFEILINSTSVSDFFNKVEYTKKMVKSDKELFEKLEAIEAETVAVESSLEIAEDTLSYIVEDKNVRLASLNEKVKSKNKEQENAQKLVDQQNKQRVQIGEKLDEAVKQLDLIASEEAKLDSELDKILAAKQAEIERLRKKSKKVAAIYSGGKFTWPLKGYYRVSSPFGYRTHPITRRKHLHNGVDIPAPKGTVIRAAGSGEVARSGYHYSYGNYVVIAHGNGYMTLYAHMSKRAATQGQVVKAGQKIGYVGTTGSSTGNHLHFSVKKGSSWLNPMKYFRK